ncbi:hypothetical protein K438DRAFT_2064773 [Mycena galopus ATCC 62051]|nr:hypothetical protein K438DRAFT_2064773 [Mycena galopus ATCC 62051]
MVETQSKRGSRRLAVEDENVMYWFIESDDGKPVSGRRAQAMRARARHIWRYLYSLGKLPQHWSDVDSVSRSYYAAEMRCDFPELRRCELDYKAHRIATDIYPSWIKKHKNDSGSVKVEPDRDDEDAVAPAAVVVGNKCSAAEPPDDAASPKKKPKPTRKTGGRKSTTTASSVPSPAPSILSVPLTTPPAMPLTTITVSEAPLTTSVSEVPPATTVSPLPSMVITSVSTTPPAPSPLSPSTTAPSPTSISSTHLQSPSIPSLPLADTASAQEIPSPLVNVEMGPPPAQNHSASIATPAAVGSSTTAAAATAATAAQARAGPSSSSVDNPLAHLGSSTMPSMRSDFVAGGSGSKKPKDGPVWMRPTKSKTPRNLCLQDYIAKNGKVTNEVFMAYYEALTPAELKHWQDSFWTTPQRYLALRCALWLIGILPVRSPLRAFASTDNKTSSFRIQRSYCGIASLQANCHDIIIAREDRPGKTGARTRTWEARGGQKQGGAEARGRPGML